MKKRYELAKEWTHGLKRARMRRAVIALAAAAFLCLSFAMSSAVRAQKITVSAAASLTNVLKDVAKAFEAGEKMTKVNNFGCYLRRLGI